MTVNDKTPLGLPEGSVRAILAIIIVVGAMILFGLDKLTFTQLGSLTLAPIALYFGQYIAKPGDSP